MIYQRQTDLIDRKIKLGLTNRECANILGCTPSVASSKLNGFIVLTSAERRCLIQAFDEIEAKQKEQTV